MQAGIANSTEAGADVTSIFQSLRGQAPSQEATDLMQGLLANPSGSLDDVRLWIAATPASATNIGNIYQQVIGTNGSSGYGSALTAAEIINPPPQVKAQEENNFEQLVALREGYRNDVYVDSVGKPTVGIGHLVTSSDNLKVGDKISDATVAALFQADSASAMTAARSQAAQAGISDPNFIPYLASVNFQLGTGWTVTFPDTWGMIVNGDYKGAANALYGTRWSIQSPIRVQDFQDALRNLPPKQLS